MTNIKYEEKREVIEIETPAIPARFIEFDSWSRQAYAIDTNQQRKINVEQKDLSQIKTIITEAVKTGTESLAQMVATGFENAASKHDVEGLHQDVENVRHDVEGVRGDISKLDERLTIVERKLDKALYREFERIDKLEKEMQVVKEKLGIPR